jgi:RNA polymerase sigma-70 factor, ECF subfamily
MSSEIVTATTHLERALAGDPVSLGALLMSYMNYLKVLSQGELDDRVRRRVSASDIVQETLLEAHRDFAKFNGATLFEFTGWLRRILINNLAQAVESHLIAAKRDVRRERSLDEVDASLNRSSVRLELMLADHGVSPSSALDQQEALVHLANSIGRLQKHYRDVIIQRHIEGRSFSEIADRTNRKPGTVRMLWVRAIEKLREQMTLDQES